MSGSKSATRNSSRPPGDGASPRGRYWQPLALSVGSAAVFAVLFLLWGREVFARAAGRWGSTFPFVGAVTLTLAVALFLSEWFGFAGREVRKVRLAARDFFFLCSLVLLLFFAAKAVIDLIAEIPSLGRGVPTRVYAYLIPLPAFAMVVRVLINSETSILFTVAASVLSAAAASGSWPALLFLLLSGTAGAARARRVPDRYRMLMVGGQTAPVCALAAAALEFSFHGGRGVLPAAAFGAVNGLLAGPIALAVMPVAEFAFGYASDIRLMELSGTGHPLLSRLMKETPGTLHHSVVVGTLAEAGALAIGANPVLCRVAALYHDVGKLGKAQYYSENQAGAANVHDAMSPGLSCAVIVSHVKEGVRIAR